MNENADGVQFAVERLRAELAEGMTEIRLGLSPRCAKADTASHSIRDAEGARRQLLGNLVAIGALRSEVGPNAPDSRVIDAIVDVDEQCPDPVAELPRNRVCLTAEIPARLLRCSERVVRTGEDDFIERPGAQP
jgi:hypothetical protein